MAGPIKVAMGARSTSSGRKCLALAFLASVVLLAASASGQKSEVPDLSAYIELEKPRYGAREPVNIVVRFENTSRQSLTILKWRTPFEGFLSNMFVVRHERDGKAVHYTGRLLKRAKPTAEEYLVIRPGKTVRTVLDLSEAYQIRKAGDYTVQLRTHIQDFGRASPKRLVRRGRLGAFYIESNTASFSMAQTAPPPPAEPELAPFNECSVLQKAKLKAALAKAQDIAFDALGMLDSTAAADRPISERYKEWFGDYSDENYGDAVANFEKIALALANEEITFNCDCSYNGYAAVNPAEPYRIQICDDFWAVTTPMTGIDSKAGTIIHELSHFYVVAGTEDIPSGLNYSGSKQLALTVPDLALRNANNHEYFAENDPALQMAGSPGWTSCGWHSVGYDKSHAKDDNWCPGGSFVTALDLDREESNGDENSPIVGEVQCCKLAASSAPSWGACAWHPVGYLKSHFVDGSWCPAGSFVTALDLDSEGSLGPGNSPIVAEARCCEIQGAQPPGWGKWYWFDVGVERSQDKVIETWCPAGSFVTELELDGGEAMDGPVVGSVRCTAPGTSTGPPCPWPCTAQGTLCSPVCGGPLVGKCLLDGGVLQCVVP